MCFRFNRLLGLCTHIFTYIFDKLMIEFTLRNIEKSTVHCRKSQSSPVYSQKTITGDVEELQYAGEVQEISEKLNQISTIHYRKKFPSPVYCQTA